MNHRLNTSKNLPRCHPHLTNAISAFFKEKCLKMDANQTISEHASEELILPSPVFSTTSDSSLSPAHPSVRALSCPPMKRRSSSAGSKQPRGGKIDSRISLTIENVLGLTRVASFLPYRYSGREKRTGSKVDHFYGRIACKGKVMYVSRSSWGGRRVIFLSFTSNTLLRKQKIFARN